MLRKFLIAACAVVILPGDMSAQSIGIGVAARSGSLGFGGEVAVNVTRFLGVRGGIGVMPFSYTGDVEAVNYRVESASPLSNIGVDFYPGFFDVRLGGGLMLLNNPTTFDARYQGVVVINNVEYSDEQVGELTGDLDHGGAAPYLVLGLGRQTNRGLGIFLDVGAAFLEEQRFSYSVTGAMSDPSTPGYDQFHQDLAAEAREIEDRVNKYVKIYPILSAGIKYGFR
ncbi:MAG: hypothetical protein KFH98_13005 [Gemmatimonadetes bacterium]|nr:hypothetical protein [Gemmatimonadota bacterium]